jgi:hypothetical protein
MRFPPFQKSFLIHIIDSHYIFYALIRQTKNNDRQLIYASRAGAYYILDRE